jgi:hypothetical protein
MTSTDQGVFAAGRKFNIDSRLRGSFQKADRKLDVKLHETILPSSPQSIRDLEAHPLRRPHLESHENRSIQEIDNKYAKGQQILSSIIQGTLWWYAGISRLQEIFPQELQQYIASMAFRTVMAKFDLETI